MEMGVAVLLFGLTGLWVLEITPGAWKRAAGGVMVLLTALIIALQLVALVFS